MKRIMIFAVAAMLCVGAFAQPKGMPQPRSTYDLVDEVRKELNLDHSQFEKVYSAYEKYNKSVFGDVDKNGSRPTPPPGGMPGGPRGNGGGPGNGGPGHGGPGFGGGHPGGQPGFGGQQPGLPGNDGQKMTVPKPADFEKMEKQRAKAEEKLVKTMKKLFKKDPGAYARWESIRDRQLKQMMPPAPVGAPK